MWSGKIIINFLPLDKTIESILHFAPGYNYINLYKDIIETNRDYNYLEFNVEFRVKSFQLIHIAKKCGCKKLNCKVKNKNKKVKLKEQYKAVLNWKTFIIDNDKIDIYIVEKGSKKYGLYNFNKDLIKIFYDRKEIELLLSDKTFNPSFQSLFIYSLNYNNSKSKLIDVLEYGQRYYNDCVDRMIRTYFRDRELI